MKKTIFFVLLCVACTACRKAEQQPLWEGASWIGLSIPDSIVYDADEHACLPAVYAHRQFSLDESVKDARLHISAMGFFDCFVNGKRVGDDVFGNLPTQYDRTIYYVQYDVTNLLQQGENTLDITLSSGYAVGMQKGMAMFGVPRVLADLQVRTRRNSLHLVSDDTWQVSDQGPIRLTDLYDGETYDARYEAISEWQPADTLPTPTGILSEQQAPSMAIMDTILPRSTQRLANGHWLVDMGQNMVGWLSLTASGTTERPVVMRFAESLQADSMTIYTDNLRDARCTNTYIPAADGMFTYCPTTVYQGFRYVDIDGLNEEPSCTGLVIYDRMATVGTFECSNPILNRLHKAAYEGIRGNYHGMPTDCPQRDERLGWLGDRFTGAYGESFLFDNRELYLKWLQDIADTQDSTGQVSHVAPAYWLRLRSTNVTWCGAFVSVAYMLLERYGDERGFRRHYDAMRRWVQFVVRDAMVDGIITKDTYGDWCMPPERQELIHSKDPSRITDGALLSTAVFYQLMGEMQVFAQRLGKQEDVQEYQTLADTLRNAYNRRFFDAETGSYANNTVTANILSLALGLVEEQNEDRVLQQIVDVTKQQYNSHVSVGVVGIQHLMRTLTRRGHADLAYTIATQTSYPSWGYMLTHGATTIWELWNGDTANPAMNSANHVMLLGDVLLWMYEDLAGIRPASNVRSDAPNAYEELYMQPCFAPELDYVRARYESVNGPISSSWRRDDQGTIHWAVDLPKGVRATVILPDGQQQYFTSSFQLTL